MTTPQIPEPIGDSPRPRAVHDAMWLAYVFDGLSAADTAAKLNRQLRVNETKGSVVSYAHRQAWAKAQVNSLPVHEPVAHVAAIPQPATPRIYVPTGEYHVEVTGPITVTLPKAPLPELETLPAPPRPGRVVPKYKFEPPAPKPAPVVDLSTFMPEAPPVFGPVKPEHLHHLHCKWPLGHPGNPSFRHCGDRRKPGEVYCPTHCLVAYPSGTRQPGKGR